jgi:hypothetical protein
MTDLLYIMLPILFSIWVLSSCKGEHGRNYKDDLDGRL